MKILIAGGHLTPALGIIEHLQNTDQVLYVGRKYALEGDSAYSLEYQTITRLGINFEDLVTGRLQRNFSKHTIPSLLKIIPGLFRAASIIKRFKPDIIIGFGGYVSVPLCIAGKLLNIPIIIHEQTLKVGLANKILSPIVNKICISWEQSRKFFPQNKTVLTGNPALSDVFKVARKKDDVSGPNLIIVGGSLGSHSINILLEQALEELLSKYNVLLQTGDSKEFNDFGRISTLVKSLPKSKQDRFKMVKFIDPSQVVEELNQADLVVTRAGMNTLSTLFILSIPSLILPLPLSIEQKSNAIFFKTRGLGEIGSDSMSSDSFVDLISAMLKNRKAYKISNQDMPLIHKNAAENVIAVLNLYVKKTTSKTESKTNI